MARALVNPGGILAGEPKQINLASLHVYTQTACALDLVSKQIQRAGVRAHA
jgi:hypothetical protein